MYRIIKRIRTDCGEEFCSKHLEDHPKEVEILHEKTLILTAGERDL